MADGANPSRRMTLREYIAWEHEQPARFEFDNGLVRMMAGGTKLHATIQRNILTALHARLRGARCQPYGPDLKVQTFPGAVYYPDTTVDCGEADPEATFAEDPRVVFEVLSRSTREEDLTRKLPNYMATPSIHMIVYVESARMHLMIWRRTAKGWEEDEAARPDGAVRLDPLGIDVPLSEIYEGAGLG